MSYATTGFPVASASADGMPLRGHVRLLSVEQRRACKMKRKGIQISRFLIPQGQHREIVPDHPRELRRNLGEQLVWREFRDKDFGDVEERTQTVAFS